MSDSPDSLHKPAAFLAPDLAVRPDASDFVEQPDVNAIPPQHEPLPKWLYLVCGIALFFAGSSFAGVEMESGYYDVGMGAPPGPTHDDQQTAADTSPAAVGKGLYNNNCASCHQGSGAGQPGTYPPMVNSEYVIGSKEMLAAILLDGVQGPLTVESSSYGSAAMPSWSAQFSDEKIADIMTYIRTSWGNKADAVTAAEVAAVRAKNGSRSSQLQQSDLEKMKSAK